MLAGLPSSASLTPQFPLLPGLKPTPPISHRRLSGEATGRHPAGSRGKESGGSLRAPRAGRMRAGRAGQGKAGQSRARQGKRITVGAFPRSPARPRGRRDYGRDPPVPSARRCRQPKGTRPGPSAHPPGRLGAPSRGGWPWKRPDLGTRLCSGGRGGSVGWGTPSHPSEPRASCAGRSRLPRRRSGCSAERLERNKRGTHRVLLAGRRGSGRLR